MRRVREDKTTAMKGKRERVTSEDNERRRKRTRKHRRQQGRER